MAQQVFWTEDFSTGIPANWQNYDPANSNVIWTWSTDPSDVTFGTQPDFASISASNGFALFDSDNYGSSVVHDVRLETPAINCANQDTVVIHFENQYAYYNATSLPQLGVSTNGINFTYFPILTNVASNALEDAVQVEEVDISAVAANQPMVYLQFRWQGNWEYGWKIDDIRLQNNFTPPPPHNVGISDFNYPIKNYATPLSQISNDPLLFAVNVANSGSLPQTNLSAYIELSDSFNVIYSDSLRIDTLPAGYQDSSLSFTGGFTPTLTLGEYQLTYWISSDSIARDISLEDNLIQTSWLITENLFSKENIATGSVQPENGSDYLIGNVYTTGSGFSAGDYIATRAYFAVQDNAPLAGKTLNFWLVAVADSITDSWDNFDLNAAFATHPALHTMGFGSYTFPAGSQSFQIVSVPLQSAVGAPIVLLQPNTRYILLLDFSGVNNVLAAAANDEVKLEGVSTVAYNNGWLLDGLGTGQNLVARLEIEENEVSTQSIILENATLDLQPNPTADFLQIALMMDNFNNADLTILLVDGQVIHHQYLGNIKNKEVRLDATQWATGVYVAKVITPKGILTKRFIVR